MTQLTSPSPLSTQRCIREDCVGLLHTCSRPGNCDEIDDLNQHRWNVYINHLSMGNIFGNAKIFFWRFCFCIRITFPAWLQQLTGIVLMLTFFTWSILQLGDDISCPNTSDMSNCVGCMSLKKCVTVTAVFIKIWNKKLKIVPYFSFWCRAVFRLNQLRRLPSSDVCFYKLSYLNYRQVSDLRCTKSRPLKDSLILEILRKAHYLF